MENYLKFDFFVVLQSTLSKIWAICSKSIHRHRRSKKWIWNAALIQCWSLYNQKRNSPAPCTQKAASMTRKNRASSDRSRAVAHERLACASTLINATQNRFVCLLFFSFRMCVTARCVACHIHIWHTWTVWHVTYQFEVMYIFQVGDAYKNVIVVQHDPELVTPGDSAFEVECDFAKPRSFNVETSYQAR